MTGRLFGYYRCNCGAKWSSAWTWEGYSQYCKNCGEENYAYHQEELRRLRWAYFYCSCSKQWSDFIDVSYQREYNENHDYQNYNGEEGYYDDRNYHGEEGYYDDQNYNNEEGYYDDQNYNDEEGYSVIRYDLEPQQCFCGNWVYPTVSYQESNDYHKSHLCGKCLIVGDCTR